MHLQINLPLDIVNQIQLDFTDESEKKEVLDILSTLYDRTRKVRVMVQAIRGLLYIAKGELTLIKNYCTPYLQYDPRDIVMEAEQLAGNPGHWFSIPFNEMDDFSGELPEDQVDELEDGFSF